MVILSSIRLFFDTLFKDLTNNIIQFHLRLMFPFGSLFTQPLLSLPLWTGGSLSSDDGQWWIFPL